MFQHTAARRRLVEFLKARIAEWVSTHSRPKAAVSYLARRHFTFLVSTHSRPKAAAAAYQSAKAAREVSTHSRPKAAALVFPKSSVCVWVSTHSRPKAAGGETDYYTYGGYVSTHSRPKAADQILKRMLAAFLFQHTAARRRLLSGLSRIIPKANVSTHSRPKAAGMDFNTPNGQYGGFNTQPPEGGWASLKSLAPSGFVAPISLSPQEKREREYNTAFSVTPAFAIS